jgi:adenosylcobyric acid synthase
MHIGRTSGAAMERPLIRFDDGRIDGAVSANGRVFGSYVHGLFATEAGRAAWLALFDASPTHAYEATVEAALDALADHLEQHIDIDRLLSLAR